MAIEQVLIPRSTEDGFAIKFITSLKYAKETLRAINNMTFMFDPNWVSGDEKDPDFPIVFYLIKSLHEISDSEISNQRMLFYNSSTKADTSTVAGSLLNVVSDNIVTKPKTYRMEILIPCEFLSPIEKLSNDVSYQQPVIAEALSGKSKALTAYTSLMNISATALNIVTTALSVVFNLSGNALTSAVEGIVNQPMFNKNSLEKMWKSRKIVKVKRWSEWAFDYLAITNLDISKEPTEEGYLNASVTLSEVPILSIRDDTSGTPKTNYTNYAVGEAIKKAFEGITEYFE